MWPYDYSRENETPLLWVSEGFTNYYGVVGTYRGGVTTKENFLTRVADAAAGIENTEARKYISPAEFDRLDMDGLRHAGRVRHFVLHARTKFGRPA